MPRRIDLEHLGERGFVIEGANKRDFASSIAPAGDVNGDGLDDVIIGAAGAHLDDGRFFAQNGKAYVIFGKKDSAPVHLSDFNDPVPDTGGFLIEGPFYRALAGQDVAGLGDLNGDGLDDVAVAGPFGGVVYVVFGKRDPLPVELSLFEVNAQGPLGYRIDAPSTSRNNHMSVDGPGDVNSDGRPDLVIGVVPRLGAKGSAYVVFGKADPLPQDVRNLGLVGADGFRIEGPKGGSMFGQTVSGAGDVNGDGLADVIVGSPAICCSWRSAYVIFGKKDAATVTIKRKISGPRRVGRFGFEIRGAEYGDFVGAAVSGAGDMNGDGRDELLVGAPAVSVAGRTGAGAAYVVHGKRDPGVVDLGELTSGYRLHGAHSYDFVGNYAAGVGDVNGDGVPDTLLGAPQGFRELRAFLVWGRR